MRWDFLVAQLKTGKALDADILPHPGYGLLHPFLHGLLGVLDEELAEEAYLLGVAVVVGWNILDGEEAGGSSGHLEGQVMGQLLELLGTGYKVALTVDLHQGTDPTPGVNVGLHQPLARYPGDLILRLGQPPLAQELYRLLLVPLGSQDGILALHYRGSRPVPEGADLGSQIHRASSSGAKVKDFSSPSGAAETSATASALRAFPPETASATRLVIRRTARMASSLAGMGESMGRGAQVVSKIAPTGGAVFP